LKSFVQLLGRDLHFNPERLLTFELHLPPARYLTRLDPVGGHPYFAVGPAPARTLERVHDALAAVPGVQAVAGISFPMLNSLVVPSVDMTVEPGRRDGLK